MGSWVGAIDSEIHGCLIYDNGWNAPDRGHGHCIYTQNKDGVKTISGCIMSAKFKGAYTVHAYGSARAYVDHFVVEDNIAYQNGPVLVGGGRPSHDIHVVRTTSTVLTCIGYARRTKTAKCATIHRQGKAPHRPVQIRGRRGGPPGLPDRRAIVIPEKYDLNWATSPDNEAKAPKVTVDVSTFLKPSERFRLLNPRDVFGEPVLSGTCESSTITVPMTGEVAPFVLLEIIRPSSCLMDRSRELRVLPG